MKSQSGIPSSVARPFRLMPRKSTFLWSLEACHPEELQPLSTCSCSSIFSTPVANEYKSSVPFPVPSANKVANDSRTETNVYNSELNQFRHEIPDVSFVPPPRRFKTPNSSLLSIRPKTLSKESWILHEAQELPWDDAFPLLPDSENVPVTPTTLDPPPHCEAFTTPKVERSKNQMHYHRRRPFLQHQEQSSVLMEYRNPENSRILLPDDFWKVSMQTF